MKLHCTKDNSFTGAMIVKSFPAGNHINFFNVSKLFQKDVLLFARFSRLPNTQGQGKMCKK